MDYDWVVGIKWYLVFILSTTLHEAAHAWSAYRMGDDTAHRDGLVSLDPAVHIQRSPMGMVVVPILSFILGGWMIGWASAPYDRDWAIQYPKRAGLMALAGPASNFLLVMIAAIFMRVGCEWGVFEKSYQGGWLKVVIATGDQEGIWALVASMLSLGFSLNLLLACFNLLPVPPLDGSSIPYFFLNHENAARYREMLHSPTFSWVGLMIAWRVFGAIYPPIFHTATKLLYMLLPGA